MARFAEGTDVPIERTRLELERLLTAYKARATAVFNSETDAAVCFEMHERRVMFRLKMPDPKAKEFTHKKINQSGALQKVSEQVAQTRYRQACQRKWRALLLAIKAKLVAVDDGIETFEEAFLAHVVMPDGQTVGEHIKPRIASSYKEGKMQPLLPPPGGRPS
jgi:hypothetical protein